VRRRALVGMLGAAAVGGSLTPVAGLRAALPVADLPALSGPLTVYLGRGEGGLYGKILTAIRERNPALSLQIRRGPSVALANTLVAEARAGLQRTDVFWAVDAGSLGLVADAGLAQPLPDSLRAQVRERFRYDHWLPVSGRIRTLAYNTERLTATALPTAILDLAETDYRIGWAPAYGSFQSFITAMRLLAGEDATYSWLRAINKRARSYAGELGVVMAAARGEVDLGFANHYYTLRVKTGRPEAPIGLAFTRNDAGCLLNASGAMVLSDNPVAMDFVRYLYTREVQSFLAEEAYEVPMVTGVPGPRGLPDLAKVQPPRLDLTRLADVRPTLALMRDAGVL